MISSLMSVNSSISPCRLTRESYTSYFTLQICNILRVRHDASTGASTWTRTRRPASSVAFSPSRRVARAPSPDSRARPSVREEPIATRAARETRAVRDGRRARRGRAAGDRAIEGFSNRARWVTFSLACASRSAARCIAGVSMPTVSSETGRRLSDIPPFWLPTSRRRRRSPRDTATTRAPRSPTARCSAGVAMPTVSSETALLQTDLLPSWFRASRRRRQSPRVAPLAPTRAPRSPTARCSAGVAMATVSSETALLQTDLLPSWFPASRRRRQSPRVAPRVAATRAPRSPTARCSAGVAMATVRAMATVSSETALLQTDLLPSWFRASRRRRQSPRVACFLSGDHACATLADGTVQCWGGNADGRLGDGTTTNRLTPVLVSGITTATSVSAGAFHNCAMLADGTVQCWGGNAKGQLGDGTTTSSNIPVQVSNITTATSVSAG